MKTPDLLICIPTYNEKENVGEMVREIEELVLPLPFNLIFIDDNSPDGTGRILDEIAKKNSRVKVLHRTEKSGIGSAHLAGIRYAYKRGYDFLLTMDCDFTHSPKDIYKFINTSKEADVVVGTRFLKSESLAEWNVYRKLLTRLGHLLTKTFLNMPYDATGAFRLYNLKNIDIEIFNKVESKGYAFFFESLYLLNRAGCKIVEVPISLPARTYGHSKMTMKEIVKSVFMLLKLKFRRFKNGLG